MKASDAKIGDMIVDTTGGFRWRKKAMVTDVGSRVIVCVWWTEDKAKKGWYNGPPYGVLEFVLDEFDLENFEKEGYDESAQHTSEEPESP